MVYEDMLRGSGRKLNTHLSRIQAFACRAPVKRPVETSFGIMRDRPAVFVRVEDADGCFGWGEVFANWPAAGAEHRVTLLERDIAPLVLGHSFEDPRAFFAQLSAKTHIRALQCGEQGPFNQVIAGLDTALWDLTARRLGQPLRQLLNPQAESKIAAYASGIHIAGAQDNVDLARTAGFGAFKVKVGFDDHRDISELCRLDDSLGPGERLFADANQGFDVERSVGFLERVQHTRLEWLEEPLVADAPMEQWAEVAKSSTIALAGGENIVGHEGFKGAIQDGIFRFIQPDVAKWGGVSGCFDVARAATEAGQIYCPHFLGGGIGLAASAEILAAVGGAGLLEVDVNPNILRSAFELEGIASEGASWTCSQKPGLGIETLPDVLAPLITREVDLVKDR